MDEYKVVNVERGDNTLNPHTGALEEYLNEQAEHGWRLATYDWSTWRNLVLVRTRVSNDGLFVRVPPTELAAIRNERVKRGMTQQELGKAVGLSTAAISYIERGIRAPTRIVYDKICKVLLT